MLIVMVAGFNIISGLVMLVKDKGKDIAVMRTVGMQKTGVMRVFMLAGSYIGIVGTFFGTIFGLLIAYNITSIEKGLSYITGTELFAQEAYFLSELPAKVNYFEVAWIIIMALLISILASYYPARRASKLDPVEALRNE
jgi:lipoprotein-releasing system permease protein